MKALYLRTVIWSPVIFRGLLGFCIASMMMLKDKLDTVTPDQLALWTTVDSMRLLNSVLLAGFVYMAGFVDQSMSRHAQKVTPPPLP